MEAQKPHSASTSTSRADGDLVAKPKHGAHKYHHPKCVCVCVNKQTFHCKGLAH